MISAENRLSCCVTSDDLLDVAMIRRLQPRARARRSSSSRSDSCTNCVFLGSENRRQLRRAMEFLARRAARPTHRSANCPSCVRQRADRVEVLQAEADAGPCAAWQEAQARVLRGAAPCAAAACPRAARCLSSASFGTSGGGGGGGVPSRLSSTHLPRLTGEVRVGFEVTVSTLAWVSMPPR